MGILYHHYLPKNLKLFLLLDFQNKLDTFLFQDIFHNSWDENACLFSQLKKYTQLNQGHHCDV